MALNRSLAPCLILAVLTQGSLRAQFQFRDVDDKSLELVDAGSPVLVYNRGMILKAGVPADRARCCYLSPVYAPNGVVITDDFPKDHFHHRGIFWAWPVVRVSGRKYDLWTIKGMNAHPGRLLRRQVDRDRATLAFENRWFADGQPVVQEEVEIVAHPADAGKRDLDFTIRLSALVDSVEIAGEPDQRKGYGGLAIRFAPRTGTVVTTPDDKNARDSDAWRGPWAQLTGNFGGREAGARITVDPSNPGYPNAWSLRHYGLLGVSYPGLPSVKLPKAQPLVLKYRVTLLAGAPP
jgi:hypothetical protein